MTQVYFENIERVISSILVSSHNSIQIAVAWFTNQVLCDCLLEALKSNQNVRIIVLDDILNRNEFGLDFGILAKSGADIRFANSTQRTMHNKFCIIDNMVITGSYNWTYHANKNKENILITDDESIVKSYTDEFEKLFNNGTPISLPYEHLKWTDVKEGDFSELRRNIFRDVIAKNDENCELKRIKLINLDHAYKSGDAKELAKASSLVTEQYLRTITDVLTSRSQDFTYKLWEENIVGEPLDNVEGYANLGKWFYVPFEIKENKYHQLYVDGSLNVYYSKDDFGANGLKLRIFDLEFINVIRLYWKGKDQGDYEDIPTKVLIIEKAKLFFYKFPSPMFNKSQPRTWKSTLPRTISAINLFGLVKEVDGGDVMFYEGWNPQKRGEKIEKSFFVEVSTEHKVRTIIDVLTSTQKRYVGELYYTMYWDRDEEPADVRFSSIDKWIFVPEKVCESINHEKYVRCYAYMYNKMKMMTLGKKIKLDVYDVDFISSIDKYLEGNDISRIPDSLICINFAKLSLFRLPSDIKDLVKHGNAIAAFCMAKEVNGDKIVYYEGWDPQTRKEKILRDLCRK